MNIIEVASEFFVLTLFLTFNVSYSWTVVIPNQRTKLALQKKHWGEQVDKYLDELQLAEDTGDKRLERYPLLTDWIQSRDNKRNKQTELNKKETALPSLKMTNWNSCDNPVLVAFGAMIMAVATYTN